MARRISDIEKIARDICWAEFAHPASRNGKTKASYWNGICDRSRQELIREAERLVWVIRVLPLDTLNLAHNQRPTNRTPALPMTHTTRGEEGRG